MSRYGDLAVEYFQKGYNCSQSVAAPFAEELGLDVNTMLKLTCGLGGGIGRLREVCGALSGAVVVLSLHSTDPADPGDKSRIYEMVQKLAGRFKAESGRDTYLCRDLLAESDPTPGTRAEERTAVYYQRRPCAELVRMAADILAETMEQEPA